MDANFAFRYHLCLISITFIHLLLFFTLTWFSFWPELIPWMMPSWARCRKFPESFPQLLWVSFKSDHPKSISQLSWAFGLLQRYDFFFLFFVRKESKFLSPWHWKIEEFQKIWKKVEEYLRLLETYGGIWFSLFLMGSLRKLILFFRPNGTTHEINS